MKNSHGGLTRARSAGLIAAGLIAGGVLAGTIGANAASSGGSSSGTAGTARSAPAPAPANAFGPAPVRSDEKQVSGSTATTLTQKAEAKVSGATAYRVESDAGDGYYEVHMKKSDGWLVTVKFDKSLAITSVETGMGKGDPGPGGGGNGPGAPGAPGGATAPGGTAG